MRVPKLLLVHSEECKFAMEVWRKDITSTEIVDRFIDQYFRTYSSYLSGSDTFKRHIAIESLMGWVIYNSLGGKYLRLEACEHFAAIKHRLVRENTPDDGAHIISFEEWKRQAVRGVEAVTKGWHAHRRANARH